VLNANGALAILGGGGAIGGSGSGISALAAFRSYNKDQVAARKAFANQPDVQRQIDNFKRDIQKINTVDELLQDRRSLEFVLTSFGLESEINNPGKLRAVLRSDPEDINSFANRLNDPRFGELNKFIGGEAFGLKNLQIPTNQGELIDDYLTNRFEQSLGAQNPAVRDALFFLRRIGDVDNSTQILGDIALRSIVTDALNLPKEIARQSVQKQASLIDSKLDIEALSGTTSDGTERRTKLDILNEDKATLSKTDKQINAALSKINALVEELELVRRDYSDLVNVTDPAGVKAAEIAVQETAIPELLRQQGLVAAADNAVKSTRANLDRLDRLINQARQAEDEEAFQLKQAEFLQLADEILGDDGFINSASYFDPNSGLTQNILRNGDSGSLPTGTVAADAKITTQVNTEGAQAITNSTDLNDFLTDLQAVRDDFAAAAFATVDDDLDAAEDTFNAAEEVFSDAEFQNNINVSSLEFGLGYVEFAKELDSASLALGKSSVDDSLSRAETIATQLDTIRQLAVDAQKDGADLVAINEDYDLAVSELSAALNTPRSVTDGATTVTLDNLLTDGGVDYTVFDANLVRAEGFDLDTDVLANLPADITVGDAETLKDAIDDTYRPAVDDAIDSLNRDLRVLGLASDTIDPRGALDARIREIQTKLDKTIASAEVEGVNLISPFQGDVSVTLQSNSASLRVDAQDGFKDAFEAGLSSLETVILSGGDDDARISALNDALFAATRVQGQLKAESYALDIQQEIINGGIAQLEESAAASDFLKPIEYTDEALKFIEKYLIQKDLEASGFGGGATGSFNQNAGLIGLFQPLAAGGNTNIIA